jgi:hypothetical protein
MVGVSVVLAARVLPPSSGQVSDSGGMQAASFVVPTEELVM